MTIFTKDTEISAAANPSLIAKAVALLNAGKLVAFPTETVYGLGADANNKHAVFDIFRVKERPFSHPLIVHIAELSQLNDFTSQLSPDVLKLAEHFWPGPLTMILKKKPHVLPSVSGGQETIGVRIPSHPVAQALLKAYGKGLAAPSANKFTRVSPTTAQAVHEELGEEVDLILDGGNCTVGLESTIVDLSGDEPIILRPGMIAGHQLADILGKPVLTRAEDRKAPRVPGMHHIHYAPRSPTLLLSAHQINLFLQSLSNKDLPIGLMTHSIEVRTNCLSYLTHFADYWSLIHWMEMPMQATSYAQHLYRTLRLLDQQQMKYIIIEAVPNSAEWEAIHDRLTKASSN